MSCGIISNPCMLSAPAANAAATLGRARARSSQPASRVPSAGGLPAVAAPWTNGTMAVAPAEGRAVEPLPVSELPVEVRVHARNLLAPAREELRRKLTRRALEDVDLHGGPRDRLVIGVAEFLEHAHARPLRRGRGKKRRRRPPLLDVLEDDRRVEDVRLAVDQR